MQNNTPPWQYSSTGSPQTPSAVNASIFGNNMSFNSGSSACSASAAGSASSAGSSNTSNSSVLNGSEIRMPGSGAFSLGLANGMSGTAGPFPYSGLAHHESLLSKNLSKSFDDDLFFCPRVLLSQEELSFWPPAELLYGQPTQQHSPSLSANLNLNGAQNSQPLHAAAPVDQMRAAAAQQQLQQQELQQQRSRFNPYTSQSFNPGV